MNERGLFIVIEGIDGSGKTTQARLLHQKLLNLGYNSILTHEPTKNKIGILLRQYLKNPNSLPLADALLFAADRVEHYHEYIKPLLEKGHIVISDRYIISSIVYQGAQGVPVEWIKQINSQSPRPDYSFYLDVDVDTALQRINTQNRKQIEKFENKAYLNKIIQNYVDELDEHLVSIPANLEPKMITESIYNYIKEKL